MKKKLICKNYRSYKEMKNTIGTFLCEILQQRKLCEFGASAPAESYCGCS